MICTRCLYSSAHPFSITFDEQGVCSGCLVHDEKNTIDWLEQWSRLEKTVSAYRLPSGRNYDCIVPVSGARDSFFVMHVVKNMLGMNPLAVTYNTQYLTAVGSRNIARLRSVFDVDLFSQTIDPNKVKAVTRATLRRLGSVYWHCIAGQTAFPVQLAVRLKIPLIIWGVHQGVDQVGMFSHLQEVEMSRKYRHEHDLMGFEAEDLIEEFDEISPGDVEPYSYPDNSSISSVGVRGIYLSNFLRWDSRKQNERMIELYGLETSSATRTFDSYRDVDSWIYNDVHDFLKEVKHGYGVVTDHVCRDIRLGHLSRSEGIRLRSAYQSRDPKNLDLFLRWIGMTKNGFDFIIGPHHNGLFWSQEESGSWVRAPQSIEDLGSSELLTSGMRAFLKTKKGKSSDDEQGFILFGRGVD